MSTCRQASQQACGVQEALYQLLRIAGLLESLPLPPRSPQADMVAASISQRATLQEREVTPHILLLASLLLSPIL